MNIKEKLKTFSDIATKEARERNAAELKSIEKKFTDECEVIRNNAQREADKELSELKYKIEYKKNQQVANSYNSSKKILIEKRVELVNSLFDEISKKLSEYVLTDDYKNNLLSKISELCKNNLGEVTIYLSKSDIAISQNFSNYKNITFVESESNIIGGFKAFIHEKGIVINNTYIEKLDTHKNDFKLIKIV